MKVFKFGGASVNSADAIRNMAEIVRQNLHEPLVVVVSAMGKTTNLLEKLIPGIPASDDERQSLLNQTKKYHYDIATSLMDSDDPTFRKLENLFAAVLEKNDLCDLFALCCIYLIFTGFIFFYFSVSFINSQPRKCGSRKPVQCNVFHLMSPYAALHFQPDEIVHLHCILQRQLL